LSLGAKRFKRQERARYDKQQTVLTPSGTAPNPRIYSVTQTMMIAPEKRVTCPFCLGLEQFRRFLVSGEKGISRGTVKCPICNMTFRMRSLMNMVKWTATEYADWVFDYSHSGFWNKVNFEVWKKRLYLMGWSSEFWDRYRSLKGEDTNESFTEYISHKQREDAMEKGWVDPQEAKALET